MNNKKLQKFGVGAKQGGVLQEGVFHSGLCSGMDCPSHLGWIGPVDSCGSHKL